MSFHTEPGDAIEELMSTKLWEKLHAINEPRAKSVINFVKEIEPYLNSIHEYFPLYTRHDCHHSYQVLRRMGDILYEGALGISDNGMTDDEIVCLIVAAYAHDIGMVLFETSEKQADLINELNLVSSFLKTDPILTKYLRDNHAERGIEFLSNSKAGHYVPKYLIGLIGDIMKGHNMSPKDLISELPSSAAIGGKNSNPVSLSILLCCADALEFSDTRVIETAFVEAESRSDRDSRYSLLEMMKHKAIGCGISVSDEGVISATGFFEESETLHVTHKTLDQIELWLREYISYDKKQKRSILKIHNPLIERESFKTTGFEYIPVAIKMDEFQIREILTSDKMWGNSGSNSIRELVQNSIDACKYKQHIKPNSIEYLPMIEIHVNHEEKSIRVTDNGIGMTDRDITDFFLQVGKSKSRDPIFKVDKKNKGFVSLARFGIGFWSVFSIAKEAIITTKYNDYFRESIGYTFRVTVDPLMPYLELKNANSSEGTSVHLVLKDSIDLSWVLSLLTGAILLTEIPCKVFDSNGEVFHEFPQSLNDISAKDLFGYRSENALSKGVKLYSKTITKDAYEISYAVPYRINNGEFRCTTEEGESLLFYMPQKSFSNVRTSVCGFSTSFKLGYIPFSFERIGYLKVNVKNPEGLTYSVTRKVLQENDKYFELKSMINKDILDGLKEFYNQFGYLNNARQIYLMMNDSKINGGNNGDTRIENLYSTGFNGYKEVVAIRLIYFEEQNGQYEYYFHYVFAEEFWNLKYNVYYACVWPDDFNSASIKSFMNAVSNSVPEKNGYILLAYQESLAMVEAANSVEIIHLKHPFKDWHEMRVSCLKIDPSKGFGESRRRIMKIQGQWSGAILTASFDKKPNSYPWYKFGRTILFVDPEHEFIHETLSLYNMGSVWDCSKRFSIMHRSNESSIQGLSELTSKKLNY